MIRFILIFALLCPAAAFAQGVQVNMDVLAAPQMVDNIPPSQDGLDEDSVEALRLKYGLPDKVEASVAAGPVLVEPVVRFVPIPAPPAPPSRAVEVGVDVDEVVVPAESEDIQDENLEMLSPPEGLLSDVVPEDDVFTDILETVELADKEIENVLLTFAYDEIRLSDQDKARLRGGVLGDLKQRLTGVQQGARISIYGYASAEGRGDKKAQRISLSRALQVRDFLVENGFDSALIDLYPQGADPEFQAADSVKIILE